MSFVINKIIIHKTGEYTGIASVKIVDESDCSLMLNKIQIDLNNGEGPVCVLKHEGALLFSGDIVDTLKEMILDVFQGDLESCSPGIYEIYKNEIKQIK
jgi:hypothetical protein